MDSTHASLAPPPQGPPTGNTSTAATAATAATTSTTSTTTAATTAGNVARIASNQQRKRRWDCRCPFGQTTRNGWRHSPTL